MPLSALGAYGQKKGKDHDDSQSKTHERLLLQRIYLSLDLGAVVVDDDCLYVRRQGPPTPSNASFTAFVTSRVFAFGSLNTDKLILGLPFVREMLRATPEPS